MADFGYPNISNKKSNEENIMSARSWMMEASDNMNFYINQLEAEVALLKKKISDMEGK